LSTTAGFGAGRAAAAAMPDATASALRRDEWRERSGFLGLSGPALLLLTIVVFMPVGWLFWLSLIEGGEISLAHYARSRTPRIFASSGHLESGV
jgi:putative spermidine/putrescine transport system permease protein/spermidine/putrescine transport system permease protein